MCHKFNGYDSFAKQSQVSSSTSVVRLGQVGTFNDAALDPFSLLSASSESGSYKRHHDQNRVASFAAEDLSRLKTKVFKCADLAHHIVVSTLRQ